MPWTKLKNIILLILALTNLFLLGLVVSQNIQSSRQATQTRQNAIQFLTERGVKVEESIIPQEMELLPQSTQRDLEEEKTAATALLKGEVDTEPRGGEVYRYYNAQGSIQFHSDGAFSAELEPGVYPVGEDRVAACAAMLETIGFRGTLLEETADGLIFQQSWNTVPLFGQEVTVICTGDSVTALVSGRRLVGEPEVDSSGETISVSTALINFLNGVSALGDVCSRIDSIQQGYVCAASLSGAMTLTPVWQVTTDTGAYQLDTVTGLVKRAD